MSDSKEIAIVNLLRAGSHLQRRLDRFFKQHELTRQQYNVLRILNGAEDKTLTCLVVRERLLEYQPDITRLIERMVTQKLVTRHQGEEDKRQVFVCLSKLGLKKIKSLEDELRSERENITKRLSPLNLKKLIELLGELELE